MAKAKRTYKKRAGKRMAKRRAKTVINRPIVSIGKGFPKKMIMTHKYFDSVQITSTSGASTGYIFSCNSMFDPNDTSTGHQPLYFDQMAALYNHYTVIGSKCIVRISPLSNGQAAQLVTLSVQDSNSSVTNDPSIVAENSLAKFPKLISSGQDHPVTLSAKWSAKKYFGGTVLSNSRLEGSAAAAPTEQSYYVINDRTLDGVNTAGVYLEVLIEYIAVWKELRDIAQS